MLPPIIIFRKVACPTHHLELSSSNPMVPGRSLWHRILSPRFLPPCDGIFSPTPSPSTTMEPNCSSAFLRTHREQYLHPTNDATENIVFNCSGIGQQVFRTRTPIKECVMDNNTRLTLPVIPRFLYKNQTQQRCPPPIIISHLPVCPVSTMRTFLRRSNDWEHHNVVFINPSSHASLVP